MPIGEKYVDLTRYLESCGKNEVSLTVEQISRIIDLPRWVQSSDKNPWANTKQSFSAGWRNAGYTAHYDRGTQIVTFIKEKYYR